MYIAVMTSLMQPYARCQQVPFSITFLAIVRHELHIKHTHTHTIYYYYHREVLYFPIFHYNYTKGVDLFLLPLDREAIFSPHPHHKS